MQPAAKEIRLSGHTTIPVKADALEAMKALAAEDGTGGLVMLSVNPETEIIELVPSNARPLSISELAKTISATEPRFTFYRFSHKHAGQDRTSTLFFFTRPSIPGIQAIKDRMVYPLMKRAVLDIASQESGLTAEKKFEVADCTDITENLVLETLYPESETGDGTHSS
uniref:Putative twinfilin-1 n=1 Tax=Discosia rubi TaxID=2502037 RepID=A0A6M6I704_9PEZI|nr:putative twinfilin-1 [Discosia rubi]